MEFEVISLEADDDIPSALKKISSARASYILLVYPQFGDVFRDKLEILLLKRFSMSCGKRLALVSTDNAIQITGRSIGLSVFMTIDSAQKRRWRRSFNGWEKVKAYFRMHFDISKALTIRDNKIQKLKTIKLHGSPIFQLPIFFLAMFAIVSLFIFFLPTASIKIVMIEQQQKVVLDLWANPGVEATHLSGGLPVYLLTIIVEGEDEIISSDQDLLGNSFSEGVVQFTNLTDKPVEVPEGTLVIKSTVPVLRYRTTSTVKVPAGAGETVKIPVKAVLPGSNSNISESQIDAFANSFGLRLEVTNPHPVTGGEDRSFPKPGKTDYQLLREKLLKNLAEKAFEDLQAQTGKAHLLIPETVQVKKIIEEKRTPDASNPGDLLRINIRVEYLIWAILKADIDTLTSMALDANLPQDARSDNNSILMTFITNPHLDGEDIRWQISAQRKFSQLWSPATIWDLTGKSKQEATRLLVDHYKLEVDPIISIEPQWMGVLPFLPFQIKAEVE